MQDQAALGPEAGLAVPASDGGVDLFVATQWLHVDRQQIAAEPRPARARRCGSRSPASAARSASREDLSHADPRLPARAAHRQAGQDVIRPRGVVLRARPPASVAHVDTSTAATATAGWSPRGATRCWTAARTRRPRPRWSPTRRRSASARTRCRTCASKARVVYTNNPPCGAMRGFGAPQALLRLRDPDGQARRRSWGMDPVELRLRNAMRAGLGDADGPGVGPARAGARVIVKLPRDPAAARRVRVRPRRDRVPGRRRQHHPRRVARARRRLRGRHQERRVLRGLRRRRRGDGHASPGRRRAGREHAHRRRRVRAGPVHGARADRPHASSASSASSSSLPTPGSARPAPPRRPGRRL